jgi:hypothetical protein
MSLILITVALGVITVGIITTRGAIEALVITVLGVTKALITAHGIILISIMVLGEVKLALGITTLLKTLHGATTVITKSSL